MRQEPARRDGGRDLSTLASMDLRVAAASVCDGSVERYLRPHTQTVQPVSAVFAAIE